MKRHFCFILSLFLFLLGCSSEPVETPTKAVPTPGGPSGISSNEDDLEKLINPEPLLALSQVGNINNTPQFIRSQKVKQNFNNGQAQRELTIHFYRNGPNRFHGPYKEWHPSGGVWKEGSYQENNRVGQWKWYAESGTLVKQAIYNQAGKPNGTWIYYHDDGAKRRMENFKDGKREGETEYYSNDGNQLLEKFSFKNDQLDGEVIRWFPLKEDQAEPQKRNESHYSSGKRNGVATEWYEDGQMRSQVEFKNGDRHGHTRRWDTEGNLELDLLFENGEPVDPGVISDENGSATDTEAENQKQDTPSPSATEPADAKP